MYCFISDKEYEGSEDYNLSSERKSPHVEVNFEKISITPNAARYAMRLRGRWEIRVEPAEDGVFASRQAAFLCAVNLHELRPASFDAKAFETTNELLEQFARMRRSAKRTCVVVD